MRRGFVHAFALTELRDKIREDDLALLDRFARLLADRGLATPAVFLVESLAPLGFLGSQLVHALVPIMGMVLPLDDIERLARLLEGRETPALFADRLRWFDADHHRRAEEGARCRVRSATPPTLPSPSEGGGGVKCEVQGAKRRSS